MSCLQVCISILHSAGDDPHGYEKASERWSPVHTVSCFANRVKCCPLSLHLQVPRNNRCSALAFHLQVESIILSIISMLSSPNDESPANIDAAKQWREHRDEFKKKVARIVRKSQEML